MQILLVYKYNETETETAKRQKGKTEPAVSWKACLNP